MNAVEAACAHSADTAFRRRIQIDGGDIRVLYSRRSIAGLATKKAATGLNFIPPRCYYSGSQISHTRYFAKARNHWTSAAGNRLLKLPG